MCWHSSTYSPALADSRSFGVESSLGSIIGRTNGSELARVIDPVPSGCNIVADRVLPAL